MKERDKAKSSLPISELKKNQAFVQKIAMVIAAVLEFEVAFIDGNLEVIAGTGQYKEEVGTVYGEGCITDKLIHGGNFCILENEPLYNSACRDCGYQIKCTLKAGLVCPVMFEEKVIGTISLFAFDENQKAELLSNREKLLDFLHKIGALISSNIGENKMHERLSLMTDQFRAVLNSIVEGIISIDQAGFITHINRSAEKLLFVSARRALGQHINNVFSGLFIPKVLEFGQQYTEQEVIYKNREQVSHFLSTITPIRAGQEIAGFVISFRSIREMRKLAGRLIREERKYSLDGILGTSKVITELKQKMHLVATTDSTILITGESGTGKELFARAIHEESHRKSGPFVAINCGAIPEMLLESELFGYEEGAFTGASRGGKPGKFELADGGTILLDEIGDMPMQLQVKLLRVLQELKIERIGGVKPVWVDVRIIAATNRNLEELIQAKQFRSDLFYRLSVIPFYIPPLREREEDLTLFLYHFLEKYNLILDKRITGFTKEVLTKMLEYPWLGNVRELENAVEYAVNIATEQLIDSTCLPSRLNEYFDQQNFDISKKKFTTLAEMEKNAITAALMKFGLSGQGKEKAAASLGMSRSTFYRKIKELGIDNEIKPIKP